MANTPPRPVLPPPPAVGAAKPVVEAMPDDWLTELESESPASAPESMIATEVIDLGAVDEPAAVEVGSAARELQPRVPTTPLSAMPATSTPTTASSRRNMQMVAGGITLLAVVVLVIRCLGGPPGTLAQRDDEIARAGGGAKPPLEDDDDAANRYAASRAARDATAKRESEAATQRDEAEAKRDAEARKADARRAEAHDSSAQREAEEQAATSAADTDVRIDDDAPTTADDARTPPASTKPSGRTDSAQTASTRSAEAQLTAEELLELARAAWKAGNARDTYKYGNKSRYKQPSDEATELVTLAACKMKQDDAAKATFKDLDGDRRKRVRNECRDLGVRVGL